MNDKIKKGRNEILLLFGTGLALSLLIIIAFNIQVGQQNLVPQIVRTILTVLLMVITYQGSKIGKWLLTGIYVFGAANIFQSQLKDFIVETDFLFFFCMFLYCCFFALFLQLSNNITAFLSYQRGKNIIN